MLSHECALPIPIPVQYNAMPYELTILIHPISVSCAQVMLMPPFHLMWLAQTVLHLFAPSVRSPLHLVLPEAPNAVKVGDQRSCQDSFASS